MIFMKISKEKVNENKVKNFCRRYWWRKWSRTQSKMQPVFGSGQHTLFPKLIKKWVLPNLTS